MTTPTVPIDAEQCRDASVVGDKAARLALAKAAGLLVPNSVSVPCEVSAGVLAAAVRDMDSRGLHACRLDVMSADRSVLADLVALARGIGQRLAVRSSAPLEDDARLAGAYSSLIGITPEEVPTAVLAVWASAIRGPGEAPQMGVLIQPELAPDWAGTAERIPGGLVKVVATRGTAEALTAGWAEGVIATVSAADEVRSAEPAAGPVFRAAAALARDVAAAIGDTMIEWAFADGRAWLLQSRRHVALADAGTGPPRTDAGSGLLCVKAPPTEPRFALRAARCAGELAERWILPWAVAADDLPCPASPLPGELPAAGQHPPRLERPAMAWQQMTVLSDQLTAQVWTVEPGTADHIASRLGSLRHGGDIGLNEQLLVLARPNRALAQQCLRLAVDLAAHLVSTGVISSARQFWALPADLRQVLDGAVVPPDPRHSMYRAALSWEPLLYSVTATGTRLGGVPVSPGMGCGPAVLADEVAVLAADRPDWLPTRPVIVARFPLPRYAPLLMGAAGLVAYGGSEAAHVVTVARSLGVPAVLGCDLSALLHPGCYVAVNGTEGSVAVLDSC